MPVVAGTNLCLLSSEMPSHPRKQDRAETADAPLSSPPSLDDALDSLLACGASYAALLHANGVSIAEKTTRSQPSQKRVEFAILGAAIIASCQALARSAGANTTQEIIHQHDRGVMLLCPLTSEQWLMVMADEASALDMLRLQLAALRSAFLCLIEQNASMQNARFMDEIEFADLSELRMD